MLTPYIIFYEELRGKLNLCIGYKNIPVNFGGAPKVPDSGK